MTTMYLISFFAVVIAVAFAAYLAMWVKRQNLGNARIEQIGKLKLLELRAFAHVS